MITSVQCPESPKRQGGKRSPVPRNIAENRTHLVKPVRPTLDPASKPRHCMLPTSPATRYVARRLDAPGHCRRRRASTIHAARTHLAARRASEPRPRRLSQFHGRPASISPWRV